MKKLKNLLIMIILFLSIIALASNVNAATTIRSSASKVTNGNNVTVTVSFGESVSAAQFVLNYDTSKFQYVSCSKGEFSGNTYAYLSLTDSKDLSSVTFTFRSKTTGSGTFSISGLVLPNKSNTISGGSTTVTVQNKSTATNNKATKTTPTPTPETTPEEVVKDELTVLYIDMKDLVESDYTEESWKALQDAISKAESATTNAEYDEVKSALTIENLVIEEFEKPELEALLRDLMGKSKDDYTEESWNELQDAIEEADNALLKSKYEKVKDNLSIDKLVENDNTNFIIKYFKNLDAKERIIFALGACIVVLIIIIIVVLVLYIKQKKRVELRARRLK